MITKEQITKEFTAELQALLNKWNAELDASDHYQGWPECGEDIRMIVTIPGSWDKDGNTTQEWTEVDLGNSMINE